MRAVLSGLVIGAMVLTGIGCSAAVAPAGPSQAWITRNGGVLCDVSHQQRATLAARPLFEHVGAKLAIHVMDTDRAVAFSWPSGDVFVSRRLMDCLSDAELSAAVAHEMGHLLADGRVPGAVASLRGCDATLDVEGRADA